MFLSFFLSFFLFFFREKNRRSRVCIIEVKKRNDTNTWIFFAKKKNQSWQDGLSHLLYSLLAWQGVHHQGSRSLAHKQHFSLFTVPKSALACTHRIPYRNAWPGHVRVTHITEGNIELQLISVTLAYWIEPSLRNANTQNNTTGTKSHAFLHFTDRLLHVRR